MPSCERCWADAHTPDPYKSVAEEYARLVQERNGACTPEQQAGQEARKCLECQRWTVHQHAHVCMVCGGDHMNDFLDLPPRWPYGGPEYHQECCSLHRVDGRGECDCLASDQSDTEWGEDGNWVRQVHGRLR